MRASNRPEVIFFDLEALLLLRRTDLPLVRPSARRRLEGAQRAGILTNAPPSLGADGIERTLVALGIDGFFERALIIDATRLPTPLPDRRAFAVAAALAEVPASSCLFVTTDGARARAARLAGLRAIQPRSTSDLQAGEPATGEPARREPGADLAGAGLAGEGETLPPIAGLATIDEDVGPSFVLTGRVVTMSMGRVLERGRVAVRRGRIVAVAGPDDTLPPTMRQAPVIETDGTICPGLIDLHNHYVYNVAPLWRVPRRFGNRGQWMSVRSKQAEVSLPVKLLASYAPTAQAIVRYVEAKAIIGGTTTGQGIRTQVNGGVGLFRGAMRNVEAAGDTRLPDSATLVPDLGRRPEDIAAFARALDKRAELGGAYFYHLAEGTDQTALQAYHNLRDNLLIRPALAGIHSLALGADDLRTLGRARSKVVWSPFSNMLLYGQTVDVGALLASRARFAIGADWAPSGSRNLLLELKVARHEAASQGVSLPASRLVGAVTADAAAIAGWSRYLGRIRAGTLADLVVVRRADGDPYDHLVDATEADISLVVIHGLARYGDRQLMEALHGDPSQPLEQLTVAGADMALDVFSQASPLNGLSFADARRQLEEALADLPGFQQRVEEEAQRLRGLGVLPEETFSLILDNEGTLDGEPMMAAPGLVDASQLPANLELDAPEVGGGSWWSRLDDQPNLAQGLKDALHEAYPTG